jgi:hypothetical protein
MYADVWCSVLDGRSIQQPGSVAPLIAPHLHMLVIPRCLRRHNTSCQEAEKAIAACNGRELDGRALNVNEARPKTDRPRGAGGGGGGRNRW